MITFGPYDYIKLTGWGPLKFGMSVEDIFEILGPTEENMEVSADTLSFMDKIVNAIPGMKSAMEKSYGIRIINYDIHNPGHEEEALLSLWLGDKGLEEIQLLDIFTPILLDGVSLINPDTIERTKQLHALSPKILMESDNILFPELGYQYQQDPTDPNLVLLSEVGVQKRIAEGYYEEGSLVDAIKAIEWYFEDEDEDE
jgi:hypothetical protein